MEGYRNQWTRRQWLTKASRWGLAAAAGPHMITTSALGAGPKAPAGDRLTLGMIGVGGMGTAHLNGLRNLPDVQILAVADVYETHRQKAQEWLGGNVATYNDYRELLARPDLDAVVIATPDHWHAMAAIHACEAGKDVYCEKPLSLTIDEGRRMVEAARRCGTVFQVGSQQRSTPHFRKACELVRSGRIGKLKTMRARIGGAPTCGFEPPRKPPAGLDWNFWLGPAPWADYTPKRCIYTFRWFYDYSGGKMTDWGAHHNDIAQWANDASLGGPVKVEPISVTFPASGLFDTAIQFEVKATYANGVELYTCSSGNDVEFHGSDGWIKVNRSRLEASDPAILQEPLGPGDVHLYESPGHHRDWLNCIKTRRQPICDIEIGHRSVTVCHLENIALRTGRTIEWDPKTETITNDPILNRWLSRPYRTPWRV